VAYSTAAPLGGEVDAECKQAVTHTVKLLESLGHRIVGERNLHVEEEFFQNYFMPVWASAVSQTLQLIAEAIGHPVTQEMVEPITWGLFEIAREKSSADYLIAINQFQRFSREVAARFEEFDIWVTPTLCSPPLPIGEMLSPPEDPLRGFFRGKDFASFTAVYNVTGQPAMSVPLFWNEAALPIGTQLAAPYAAEGILFQLAAQLERAQPWAQRRPPNV
jgi:amidase